jgi:serine/threonine protein kinase
MTRQLNWIGLKVGGFVIDSLISDGPFSSVYKGLSVTGSEEAAFKVAKPPEYLEKDDQDLITRTQAKASYEGRVARVSPDSRDLLITYYDKTHECYHPALAPIYDIADESDVCFLQMEYLPGQTLRQLMDEGPLPLEAFIEIACHLDDLSKTTFEYHGDIRPDNIVVTDNGIKLVDCGYFGEINCQEGKDLDCAVTNHFYYPTLEPDDVFAFGMMLWESVLGEHPLTYDCEPQENGESLTNWIAAYEAVGQHYLSPLRYIQRPLALSPKMDPSLEEVILQSLGLKLGKEGQLERSSYRTDYQEILKTLQALKKKGVAQV